MKFRDFLYKMLAATSSGVAAFALAFCAWCYAEVISDSREVIDPMGLEVIVVNCAPIGLMPFVFGVLVFVLAIYRFRDGKMDVFACLAWIGLATFATLLISICSRFTRELITLSGDEPPSPTRVVINALIFSFFAGAILLEHQRKRK